LFLQRTAVLGTCKPLKRLDRNFSTGLSNTSIDVLYPKLRATAWEVRVGVAKQSPAVPDFPVIIFVEFQTNIMSADGINDMSAQAPKKIPYKKKKSAHPTFDSRLKRFWKGFGETFSSKRFPQKNIPQEISPHAPITQITPAVMSSAEPRRCASRTIFAAASFGLPRRRTSSVVIMSRSHGTSS